MYVTRPLSMYIKSPEDAAAPPPEGPNSGYLVVADEEYEEQARCCFGMCKDSKMRKFPFPQNKTLTVRYTEHYGETHIVHCNKTYFIPVQDQPLSSNRYYVIQATGKHRGNVCTCSKEEDMSTRCFCRCINDMKPRPLDHRDVYQQVEVTSRRCSTFTSKSVAPDGFPPLFLRRRGWEIISSTPKDFQLGQANGVDLSLRGRLPPFDFPISGKHPAGFVVGKWYIPFMFLKEGGVNPRDQMQRSMFYEMYLERLWEDIYVCNNNGMGGNVVAMKTTVPKNSAGVFDKKATIRMTEGMMWFDGPVNNMGVGLSMAVVDRMTWEACRGGWVDGIEKDVKVEREEVFGGPKGWTKFGCYILVERFVLKRLDGSTVLTYDFKLTNVVQSKWE